MPTKTINGWQVRSNCPSLIRDPLHCQKIPILICELLYFQYFLYHIYIIPITLFINNPYSTFCLLCNKITIPLF